MMAILRYRNILVDGIYVLYTKGSNDEKMSSIIQNMGESIGGFEGF
jgi:hypothetical protein